MPRYVGGALESLMVLDPKVPALAALQQPVDLAKSGFDLMAAERVLGVDGGVDARDQRRQGAQPGELWVVQDESKEITGRHRAVPRLVREPLAVQEKPMQAQQPGAELTQTIALGIHAIIVASATGSAVSHLGEEQANAAGGQQGIEVERLLAAVDPDFLVTGDDVLRLDADGDVVGDEVLQAGAERADHAP